MWHIGVSRCFSAAHRVIGQGGRCEQTHGHNYRVEVILASALLRQPGMVADFASVRAKLDSILPDHCLLNDLYDFNPTAENLARYFYEEMSRHFPVHAVRVWENDECWAEYRRARE